MASNMQDSARQELDTPWQPLHDAEAARMSRTRLWRIATGILTVMGLLGCAAGAVYVSSPQQPSEGPAPMDAVVTSLEIARTTSVTAFNEFLANTAVNDAQATVGGHVTPEVESFMQFCAGKDWRTKTDLHLNSYQMADHGAEKLAKALPYMKNLREVYLSDNSIGDAGATAIASALPDCPKLKVLSLAGNDIRDAGATAIALALPNCPELQYINLLGNNIGSIGAKMIAKALPHMKSLERLSLFNNSIGDTGARALADALPKTPNLELLDLRYNYISDDGKEKLRKAALPGLDLEL